MKTKRFSLLLMLIVAFAALGVNATRALARTDAAIVVNSLEDSATNGDGKCTLRKAITNANSNTATFSDCAAGSGADTITFSVTGTITLFGTLPVIIESLTLDGPGIEISGNNSVQLFQVGASLTLKNILLREAKCAGCNGGAILNWSTLNLINSSVILSSAASGGAIYNMSGGIVNFTNSWLGSNTVVPIGSGGGIFNESGGTVTVTGSTLSSNAALYGGGVANFGTLTVTNSTFLNNAAYTAPSIEVVPGYGGGILNYHIANISNSTFSGNLALGNYGGGAGTDGYGGAIANGRVNGPAVGVLSLTASTVGGNSAGHGGGIFNGNDNSNHTGTLNILNTTIHENVASVEGGGMDVSIGTVNFGNSTLSQNSAPRGGGALNGAGAMNIANSTLSGNSATDLHAGGNLYVGGSFMNPLPGTVTLKNSILTRATGDDCKLGEGGTLNGSRNLMDDTTCGSAPSFRLGAITNFDKKLRDNGGATQTHALLANSNAIDAVNDCAYISSGDNPLFGNGQAITTDQRGYVRPAGNKCDIGAYEYAAALATATPTKTNTPTQTRTPTKTNTPLASVTSTPTATPTQPSDCTAKPSKPALKKPASAATVFTDRVMLKWNGAACAQTYNVVVKDTATGKKVDSKKGLTVLKFKTKSLTNNSTYKWFAQACNSFGCVKAKARTFTTQY